MSHSALRPDLSLSLTKALGLVHGSERLGEGSTKLLGKMIKGLGNDPYNKRLGHFYYLAWRGIHGWGLLDWYSIICEPQYGRMVTGKGPLPLTVWVSPVRKLGTCCSQHVCSLEPASGPPCEKGESSGPTQDHHSETVGRGPAGKP